MHMQAISNRPGHSAPTIDYTREGCAYLRSRASNGEALDGAITLYCALGADREALYEVARELWSEAVYAVAEDLARELAEDLNEDRDYGDHVELDVVTEGCEEPVRGGNANVVERRVQREGSDLAREAVEEGYRVVVCEAVL